MENAQPKMNESTIDNLNEGHAKMKKTWTKQVGEKHEGMVLTTSYSFADSLFARSPGYLHVNSIYI
jgi:hypothetical protein